MIITTGEYTIIDFNDIDIAYEEPVNPSLNQIWLDIDSQPPVFKRWNGEDWEPCRPINLYELDAEAWEAVDSHETKISVFETQFLQLDEAITSKVSQTDYDEFGNAINEQISTIEQTAEDLTLEFGNMNENITNLDGDVEEIKTGIKFDDAGMHIGKSDSPLQMTLSNEQLEFIDNSQIVAYINGQKLFITMAEVLDSLVVGNHKIQKYDETITIVRWVG